MLRAELIGVVTSVALDIVEVVVGVVVVIVVVRNVTPKPPSTTEQDRASLHCTRMFNMRHKIVIMTKQQ